MPTQHLSKLDLERLGDKCCFSAHIVYKYHQETVKLKANHTIFSLQKCKQMLFAYTIATPMPDNCLCTNVIKLIAQLAERLLSEWEVGVRIWAAPYQSCKKVQAASSLADARIKRDCARKIY